MEAARVIAREEPEKERRFLWGFERPTNVCPGDWALQRKLWHPTEPGPVGPLKAPKKQPPSKRGCVRLYAFQEDATSLTRRVGIPLGMCSSTFNHSRGKARPPG